MHFDMYAVTATTKATEALKMLRKKKKKYDIVITDVIMLDMNGFELLEIIGLEMDVPVISKLIISKSVYINLDEIKS